MKKKTFIPNNSYEFLDLVSNFDLPKTFLKNNEVTARQSYSNEYTVSGCTFSVFKQLIKYPLFWLYYPKIHLRVKCFLKIVTNKHLGK